MATTTVPVTTIGSIAAPVVSPSMTTVLTADDGVFANNGKTFLLVRNETAGAAAFDVTSVADEYGRTGDISAHVIDAGENALLGPFPTTRWNNASGELAFDCDIDVECAALLPV